MVELLTGISLFLQQFKALFIKNTILSWRNKVSSFLQIFSSIFFIFLIFIIDKAIRTRFDSSSVNKIIDPKPIVFPPIPRCEENFFIREPCYDFAWSGSDNLKFVEIVSRIRVNNPGRVIPEGKDTCVSLIESSTLLI